MKLHNTIKRAYQKILKLFQIEVLSDKNLWCEIDSLNITNEQESIQLLFNNNISLICAPDHILIDSNNNEIFAKDSLHKEFIGKKCNLTVKEIKQFKQCKLYDLSLKNNHTYFTNDVLSHNCVVMDEAAFVPNNIASKVFESIYPVISSAKTSQFIIVSTPNGADNKNLYYELWQKANSTSDTIENKEGWKPFRFDWWDVPNRDEAWKESTIAAIGEQRFAQEFGNEFLSTSSLKKLIPTDIIEKYRMRLAEYKARDRQFAYGKKQYIMNENQDKCYEFIMWHEFDPAKTYLASGDCSSGIGADSSVLYVWDVTDLGKIIMCAKFSSNQVSPIEFAFVTAKILNLYNSPFYICERNGVGSGYLDSLLVTYKYSNIVKEGKNNDYGIYSHVSVKEKACIWAREMITTNGFDWVIYDKALLDDFEVFVKKDTNSLKQIYSAPAPAHDDHVMSWIWACWVLNPDIVEQYFICCQTFKSQLENIYPKILQPLNNYTTEQIKNISNDKLYKDFLEFKDEIKNKIDAVLLKEQNNNALKNIQKNLYDPYFDDIDNCADWRLNNSNIIDNKQTFQRNTGPIFFMP